MSVVGAFEHDAGVVRTASTVGQFAGTSGSISGYRWVNFGAGWSFYGDRWVNLRGRWVRLRGRKLFLCWTFKAALVKQKGVTPAENHFLILSLSRKEVGGFMIASSEF